MNKQPEVSYKKIDNFFFDPTKPVGKGAFGAVFKAFDESRNNLEVAAKMIPAAKLLESEDQYNLFMREIEVLRQIRGNHIVQLIDVKRTPNNLYIFIDYCDGGDLEKKMKTQKSWNEQEALSILKQIADAFVTLDSSEILNNKGHKVSIMHRDIKPANILFHKGQVKIADFGFAKLVDEVDKNQRKAHTLLGTPLYMPPQILNDENYSAKCDIWSTGVLIYELMYGKHPWTGHSVPNLYSNIKSKTLEFTKQTSSETKDLLSKMLKLKDEERLSWKEVYEHPALKNINIVSHNYNYGQVTQSTFNQMQANNNSPSNNSNTNGGNINQGNYGNNTNNNNNSNQGTYGNYNQGNYGGNNQGYQQNQHQNQNYNNNQYQNYAGYNNQGANNYYGK